MAHMTTAEADNLLRVEQLRSHMRGVDQGRIRNVACVLCGRFTYGKSYTTHASGYLTHTACEPKMRSTERDILQGKAAR